MALLDAQGNPVQLGKRLGRGGEGEVFEVAGQPALAAKVLHDGRGRGKAEKVRQMLARPPAGAYEAIEGFPVLTWPRSLLQGGPQERGRGFAGYTMTRVLPQDFVPLFRLTTAARRKGLGGPPLTWDRMVLLGMRLCHVVRTLHRFGYAVGDLNDRNVLVSRRLTPLFMDTDSFQVPRPGWGHFPSIVGDQLYWPPELLDVDLARHKGSRETGDRFALGVLLFQLFMDGLRPYQARGSLVDGLETIAQKTRAGHYPWDRPRPGVLEPPGGAPSYAALPRPIRQAFERCFVAGHRNPGKRPTADEWHGVLSQAFAEGFQACAMEPQHVFGKAERACPWCQDLHDRFTDRRPVRLPPKPGKPPVPVLAAATPRRPAKAKAAPPAKPRPKAGRPARTVPAARPAAARSRPPAAPAMAPRPKAAAPRKAKPKARARARPGPASRWPARALWLTAVLLAFATPAAALAQAPDGLEKRVVTSAASLALVGGLGVAAACHWLSARRSRVVASWAWLTVALCLTLAVAASGRWAWMTWAAGAACLAAGLGVFAWLERRDPAPFRPDRRGLLHGALGLPAAYLPVAALWGWRLSMG